MKENSAGDKLPPLPGTADAGLWTGTNEFGPIEMPEAVFPIFKKLSPVDCEIVGTGFYVLRNGCFVTARHVLEQDLTLLFGLHFGPGTTYALRPVIAAHHHPTSDISVGVFQGMEHKVTGARLANSTMRTRDHAVRPGEIIATYSYPLHAVHSTTRGAAISVQPNFYDGKLGERYEMVGPSAKLACPYYQADLHLYGASSGGPVVSREGGVFAVASASYDGINDLAFLTPIQLAGDIIIPAADLKDGKGVRDYPFREIVHQHFKKCRRALRSTI